MFTLSHIGIIFQITRLTFFKGTVLDKKMRCKNNDISCGLHIYLKEESIVHILPTICISGSATWLELHVAVWMGNAIVVAYPYFAIINFLWWGKNGLAHYMMCNNGLAINVLYFSISRTLDVFSWHIAYDFRIWHFNGNLPRDYYYNSKPVWNSHCFKKF